MKYVESRDRLLKDVEECIKSKKGKDVTALQNMISAYRNRFSNNIEVRKVLSLLDDLRQEKNPVTKLSLEADIKAKVPSEDVLKEIEDLVLHPRLKFAKLPKK